MSMNTFKLKLLFAFFWDYSAEKSAEIDQLKSEMKVAAAGNMQSEEVGLSVFSFAKLWLYHMYVTT